MTADPQQFRTLIKWMACIVVALTCYAYTSNSSSIPTEAERSSSEYLNGFESGYYMGRAHARDHDAKNYDQMSRAANNLSTDVKGDKDLFRRAYRQGYDAGFREFPENKYKKLSP